MIVIYIVLGAYIAFWVLILLIAAIVKIHALIYLTKEQRAERKIMVAEQVRVMDEQERKRERRARAAMNSQYNKANDDAVMAGTLATTSAGAAACIV